MMGRAARVAQHRFRLRQLAERVMRRWQDRPRR